MTTLAILLSSCEDALAQPEPVTVFADSGLSGIFCSYDISESGDCPDTLSLATSTSKRSFIFFNGMDTDHGLRKLGTVTGGMHVTFSLEADYAYHKSADAMFTFIMIKDIEQVPGTQADYSVCMSDGESSYGSFEAEMLSGHFCGYTPGTAGHDSGTAAMKTADGIYSMTPRLDGMEKLRSLSLLALGTPVNYSLEIRRNIDSNSGKETSPPIAEMTSFERTGQPVPDVCRQSEARQ
ncbi:MAG: hypothetical protein LBQ79_11985 [Deltaproteobacteria bacterium]|nr:hypothetical protein [Deltaproteobacteria bacterium]